MIPDKRELFDKLYSNMENARRATRWEVLWSKRWQLLCWFGAHLPMQSSVAIWSCTNCRLNLSSNFEGGRYVWMPLHNWSARRHK